MSKEPIQTSNAPAAIGAYSQAIKSGDLLFISESDSFKSRNNGS